MITKEQLENLSIGEFAWELIPAEISDEAKELFKTPGKYGDKIVGNQFRIYRKK